VNTLWANVVVIKTDPLFRESWSHYRHSLIAKIASDLVDSHSCLLKEKPVPRSHTHTYFEGFATYL